MVSFYIGTIRKRIYSMMLLTIIFIAQVGSTGVLVGKGIGVFLGIEELRAIMVVGSVP